MAENNPHGATLTAASAAAGSGTQPAAADVSAATGTAPAGGGAAGDPGAAADAGDRAAADANAAAADRGANDAAAPADEDRGANGAAAPADANGSADPRRAGTAHRAPLKDFQDATSKLGAEENLDVVLDIPVTIAMEIGRARLPIRNLLQLNQGSVVELERLAGEPLDVTVNGTLIAHGEVVVVNERYGIRLTDVISPAERVRKLK